MRGAKRIFVSHSRKDNAFTTRLVDDLRTAGADVWVDMTEITSNDFVRRINEGLADRDWLVLVLSPDALRSDWVRSEVNAALTLVHQKRLRGIIPIVVRPVREKDIPPLWNAQHMYDATKNYAAALAGLLNAMQLAASGSNVGGAPQPPVEPTQRTQGATSGQSSAVASVWRVDPSGTGDFWTIKQALEKAQPGDRILIAPGTYQEGVTINKPLELVGEGDAGQTIIEGTWLDEPVDVISKDVYLGKLTFHQRGAVFKTSDAVQVSKQGEVVIEDCILSSPLNSGIYVREGSATLRRCRIRDCRNGVKVWGTGANQASAVVEETVITGCSQAAVVVENFATITLRRNQITGNQREAVELHGNLGDWPGGKGIVEDNDLRGNERGAWRIREGAQVQRARNQE